MDFKKLFNLPGVALKHGWNLHPSIRPTAYILLEEKYLTWGIEVNSPPHYDTTLQAYDFKEGLWKQDCAEIFITDSENSAYQEFNLAPSGAYWSGLFSSYRTPSKTPLSLQGIEIEQNVTSNSWSAAMKIPISCLAMNFSTSSKINLTTIIHSSHYYSLLEVTGNQPDFHKFPENLSNKNLGRGI